MKKNIFENKCELLTNDHVWPLHHENTAGSTSKENIIKMCSSSNNLKGSINGIRYAVTPYGLDENNKMVGRLKIKKTEFEKLLINNYFSLKITL